MIQKEGQSKEQSRLSARFTSPTTLVSERIDQVTAYCTSKERQAEWLKRTLEEHWAGELPQPFVGFDEDEDAFVLVWQSDTECHTLYIDADNHRGTYCPWPGHTSEEPLEELNLNTEEAWIFLQGALTTMTN